jgi:hypothetical protein
MTDYPAPAVATKPQVVFVYSCFRGSSTWFWSRLRAERKFCCYYEIFNERLAHLVAADASNIRSDNWSSHHPKVAPYYLEFMPLLGDAPGVPHFPVEHPLGGRFIGKNGIDGALDPDVEKYIASLITHAQANGRVPVLTDPRLLARAAGCRMAFGGTHILVVRNLFEQWVSVCGQWRAGNDYFLRMAFDQLRLGQQQDRFFAYLLSRFPNGDQGCFEEWARDANLDLVFACYVALCIYLLVRARRQCDLVVDVSSLVDAAYGANIESSLTECLGVHIGLGDFERRVDYPKRLVESPQVCRANMEEFVQRALSEADADPSGSKFANSLLDGVWRARAEFIANTAGARELLDAAHAGELQRDLTVAKTERAKEASSLRAALSESQQYAASLLDNRAREQADAAAERDALRAAAREAATYADSLKQALDVSHEHADSLARELDATKAYAASQAAQLAWMRHRFRWLKPLWPRLPEDPKDKE